MGGCRNGAAVCCISKWMYLNGLWRQNFLKPLTSLKPVLNPLHAHESACVGTQQGMLFDHL